MSGLVLKLAPNERVLVNGAVIENGDRRSKITILTANANILRLRDAIPPEQANTPVRRVCYITQLLLTGDADETLGRQQAFRGIEQLSQAFIDCASLSTLDQATIHIEGRDYYRALRSLRTLIPRESRLLAQVN